MAGREDERGLDRRSTSYGTSSTDASEEDFTQQDIARLTSLAKSLSRADTRAPDVEANDGEKKLGPETSIAGLHWGDDRLNPLHAKWDLDLWLKVFIAATKDQDLLSSKSGFLFRNLNITGVGNELQLQQTIGSLFMAPFRLRELLSKGHEKHILHDFEGVVRPGEMLIVLGRPGSGCSTFLRSICGELKGLNKRDGSVIEYNGLDQAKFKKEFRGEAIYSAETEFHFPHLTVGQTLEFAAAARTPSARIQDAPRKLWYTEMAKVVMAIFGLSHTKNTKVGNDFVRGVSGGERKRVSLAEMALAGAPIGAWDNSTRGLDSATALEFARALRRSSDVFGATNAVAIYQASQSIYDLFDKVIVLYEGREIFFGPADQAKAYFENMGWQCPQRQTTGDFLTSVTNAAERKAKPGCEKSVPRTAAEFEKLWKESEARKALLRDMDDYQASYSGKETYENMHNSHKQMQADHTRPKSPYMISVAMQTRLCIKRAYQRLWNDKISTITTVGGNIIMALIVASIYYGSPPSTSSFFSKGALLFFAVLLNALSSITEINMLYEQRPIVRKHMSYAFYHPFTEALAGIISDLPIKFLQAVAFNLVLYFLGGLAYTASKFFIFFLFTFLTALAMSAVFRSVAAATKTITQAMAIAGVLVLALVIYTGFVLTPDYQRYWLFWIKFINPISYAYEALLTNEVHGVNYECANLVPPYGTDNNFVCAVAGAEIGQRFVNGDTWVSTSYNYTYAHVWRNLGIVIAFMVFFYVLYLFATEFNSASGSTAEFLVFRRGHAPKLNTSDEEGKDSSEQVTAQAGPNVDGKSALPPQKDVFTWRDVTLDIMIKDESRRLLDNVSGWVKPGTLTALMGTSGAGKTTLLDTLAQRMRVGVLTGDMFVNGKPLPASFQRSTGYVQQQDLHLETTTVREALQFSAMLRQPKSTPVAEKKSFVEEIIAMLGMEDFAEAVVGNIGEGLNVEQRKLLTIGVELAAKPDLLLFLDEPTSGLDSQSSWSICAFLRKLADGGQAVLCTIHQPSAILFQNFDRLLFLAKGGKTVYFGDIGSNSKTLLDYFSANGARRCDDDENPAEYMLEIAGDKSTDWHKVWKESNEAKAVQTEIDRIHKEQEKVEIKSTGGTGEFATTLGSQIYYVTLRVFQQYWRDPSYVAGKFMLGIASALFVGFSYFLQRDTQTGMQNLIFSIFMLTAIFSTLVQQIMPRFVAQRSLYEVRERPSKTYSWIAFIFAQIVVEIPYQAFLAILAWASWYWTVFGKNQTSEQQGLMLLFIVQFYIFASTFAHLLIAGLPDATTAGAIATLLFSMTLIFNGVMQPPSNLPGFWIFMYRVSPLTYFVAGSAATGAHNIQINCSGTELAVFPPPSGTTCADYLAPYLQAGAPGYLVDPTSTTSCSYCPLTVSDQYLASSNIYWSERWRNFGIFWVYIIFNIFAAVALYYLLRVKQWNTSKKSLGPKALGTKVKQCGQIIRRFFTDKPFVPLSKKKTNNRIF